MIVMDELGSEAMARIIHDVELGVPPDQSSLAPMTAEQLAFRERVIPEIEAIKAKGGTVDIGSFAS